MTSVRSVPERLRDAAKLFEERNKSYGGNYQGFGRVMTALFPDGLGNGSLTVEEWGRLTHVVHLMTKLTRYCSNLRKGGHSDSLEDLSVYAQMSAELDDTVVFEKDSETQSKALETLSKDPEAPSKSADTYYGHLGLALSTSPGVAEQAAKALSLGNPEMMNNLIMKASVLIKKNITYDIVKAPPPGYVAIHRNERVDNLPLVKKGSLADDLSQSAPPSLSTFPEEYKSMLDDKIDSSPF